MLRTHTCGELNISNLGQLVTLCGWVQKSRDLGGTTFIDVAIAAGRKTRPDSCGLVLQSHGLLPGSI